MADMEEIAVSNRKAIVFSQWVQTIRVLSERLRRFHPIEYHGKTNHKDRDEAIERFRDDPDCHVILMDLTYSLQSMFFFSIGGGIQLWRIRQLIVRIVSVPRNLSP